MLAAILTVTPARNICSVKAGSPVFEDASNAAAEVAHCKGAASCICSIADETIAARLLTEYGAIFAADKNVVVAYRCIFENDEQVAEYQKKMPISRETMGGVTIELQKPAMDALLAARAEAAELGLSISPLDGSIAARRSYSDTVRIWNSRFLKALDHWSQQGKILSEDAADGEGRERS